MSERVERAVALRHDDGEVPHVVAKGYGSVAEQIIEFAMRHDVHVHRSPELVGLLMRLDVDQRIPAELYRAVAELLAWLYMVDGMVDEASSSGGK
ncbi:EscU/YscU/HrcU family type III secretion system export apparatus switch protein [Halotalea alkalilenta]|uniref:Flagellar biosynthetic protein FlhB n=1 Tax=Halotalea alkalilenta TaxID=376489 RepID=A0A172YGQ0_9GAMM|nr:EscU/YscU/HrcU family type III secretion system export apparatus switch protein [Halotalea alkalilenta]ANF58393.1 hypothetical protein A5892_13695 [Halotalea alkalilenta]